jgi:hypothetical protein
MEVASLLIKSCLVNAVSSVLEMLPVLAFCILCSTAAKFLLYKLSPDSRVDHYNHCQFDLFCRSVKSFHSHRVKIHTILVEEACCKS